MPKPALSPVHWPFEQPGVLLVVKQHEHALEQDRLKSSTSIRDVEFQTSDGEESSYSPSELSADESDEDEDEEKDPSHIMTGAMQTPFQVDEDEIKDLARDLEENSWPSSPTPSQKRSAAEEVFQAELRLLDSAEQEAASVYNPDEVVALLTEFYELLVEMAHWPLGTVNRAPHTEPAVNVRLGRELGYDETVLDLMQKLPFVSCEANQSQSQIIPDSYFYIYTLEEHLREAKKHIGYYEYEVPIDSWVLPIAGLSNREGWSIVLDTRLGVIRAHNPMECLPKQGIEFKRYKDKEERSRPVEYHLAPLVPAATYLRTLIECYRTLSRVPLMEAYNSDPIVAGGKTSENMRWHRENIQDEQNSILELYKECGWPDHWDRPAFVERLRVLEPEIRERARARMIRDGALT